MKRLSVMLLSVALSFSAAAIDTDKAFDDPELQARYEKLIAEVRCVTCQNQNIKDSNAFIAADLRREIRRLLEEGKTDAEVADFLVTRYGDFVLYNPRKSGKTLVLWVAPFILLFFGAIGFARVLKTRMAMPIDESEEEGRQ